uniref:Mitochondrial cardiolipin hydrolase n=1 Tax=Salarias fasciatus TaxID=181472 RepID=A0A672GHT6_SALFA
MWAVKVVFLGFSALLVTVELISRFLHCRKPRRTTNEVLFFPSKEVCVERLFRPSLSCTCPLPHGIETSFSLLLRHILSASSSMDLCIFAFSNVSLCRAVLELHRRGVIIRVLSDKDYAAINGSQIGVLRRAGICVRCDCNSTYMHHKFAVVDKRLLITGSLNWTLSAVHNNMENIIVTDEPDLVQPFIGEFNRLWEHNNKVKSGQVWPLFFIYC